MTKEKHQFKKGLKLAISLSILAPNAVNGAMVVDATSTDKPLQTSLLEVPTRAQASAKEKESGNVVPSDQSKKEEPNKPEKKVHLSKPTIDNNGYVNASNNKSYTVSGTGDNGATVELKITDSTGKNLSAETLVSSSTYQTNVDISLLADGPLTIIVKQRAEGMINSPASTTKVYKDTVVPVITVEPYNEMLTNQSITVNVQTNEGSLNESSHVFHENGNFEFIATDEAGNTTTHVVTITNIDKTPPVITVAPYSTTPTNQSITVNVQTNEGSLNETSYTFDENGSFEFVATDEVGNTTSQVITITNIDKTPPVLTIEPYTTTPTNQSIVVNAHSNEGILNESTHIFDENGNFEFVARDEAGNITTQTVTITNIDKTPPIVSGVIDGKSYKEDVTISFNEGNATLNGEPFIGGSISEEGEYHLKVTDRAQNITSVTFRIDKTPPEITLTPYTTTPTNQSITVHAQTNEGSLNVTSYTFEENGSFEFVATDEAGNVTSQIVSISNIDKTPPVQPVVNQIEDDDTVVTGKAEAGSLVKVMNGDTELGYAIANDAGDFSVMIEKLLPNTILTVTASDSAGNTGPIASITVSNSRPIIISHTPVTTSMIKQPITINAEINGNTEGMVVKLFFKSAQSTSYNELTMVKGDNNTYSASIPSNMITLNGIDYYIEATDAWNHTTTNGTATTPNKVTISDFRLTLGVKSVIIQSINNYRDLLTTYTAASVTNFPNNVGTWIPLGENLEIRANSLLFLTSLTLNGNPVSNSISINGTKGPLSTGSGTITISIRDKQNPNNIKVFTVFVSGSIFNSNATIGAIQILQ